MTTDELDLRLHRLGREVQAAADVLLELELDPTRELLEKSTLTGATASAWAAASGAVARAWEGQSVLEGHLERVRELRGRRSKLRPEQLLELEELLDGPAVAVPGEPGARCTAGELLARSAAAVGEARGVLTPVARAWDELVPRLGTANATLKACTAVLEELGEPPGDDLEAARRELGRLTDAVAFDPLAATAAPVDALEADVAAVRAGVERLRDFRADVDGRLAAARALLDEARAADGDAREAHRLAVAKIAAGEVPEPAPLAARLAEELDDAEALARSGAWREAGAALDGWTARAARARDEARRSAAASRAPVALRDELRGRLGAYQAKARSLRLLEDPALAGLYERAHRVLHTAPTDLREATELVRRYQRGVSSRPASEVLR
jgi:hypothetical protein